MSQVVDASTVVAALIDAGRAGQWSELRLMETDAVAPHLMPFEVASALRRHVPQGVLSASQAVDALHKLLAMKVSLLPFDVLAERIWSLRSNLTTYDASYVAAAELFRCRLLTFDRKLAASPGLQCEVLVGPLTP